MLNMRFVDFLEVPVRVRGRASGRGRGRASGRGRGRMLEEALVRPAEHVTWLSYPTGPRARGHVQGDA